MIAIDMKLPDSCVTCRFSQGDYGFCHAMPENFCGQVNDFEEQGRPEWCPLVQVDKLMVERLVSQDDLLTYSRDKIMDHVKFNASRMIEEAIAKNEKYVTWSDMSNYGDDDFCCRLRCTAYVVNVDRVQKYGG